MHPPYFGRWNRKPVVENWRKRVRVERTGDIEDATRRF